MFTKVNCNYEHLEKKTTKKHWGYADGGNSEWTGLSISCLFPCESMENILYSAQLNVFLTHSSFWKCVKHQTVDSPSTLYCEAKIRVKFTTSVRELTLSWSRHKSSDTVCWCMG